MPAIPQLTVQQRAITSLRPWARNARTYSKKQIRQIADSIDTFGFTNPVLIDGQGTILAGHGRVRAAALLGLCEVPCVELDHLSEDQKRAYVLADTSWPSRLGGTRSSSPSSSASSSSSTSRST